MKKSLLVMVLFTLVLSTSGCDLTTSNALTIKAVTSELKIEPSSTKVEEFLDRNKDFTTVHETDICYNITPDFIANHSDYSIFKYASSAKSFLLFEDEIYVLGSNLTSVALGDLDKDNLYELYFTFSWGSGVIRSQVGYFNPSTKKVTVFDNQYFDEEMFRPQDIILTTNEQETSLFVNKAITEYDTLVDFNIKSNKLVANIVLENDIIKLNSIVNNSPNK